MKKGFYYYSNLALAGGLALIIYVIYASLNHQMSFVKLGLFWLGASGVAYFLLYRILSRLPTYRGKSSVPQYKRSYRVACTVLLLLCFAGVYIFADLTWNTWQQPAVYWKLLSESSISPNHYQMTWTLGNQNYERAVHLQELQLVELASVDLDGKNHPITIGCQIDSLRLTASRDSLGGFYRFRLPDAYMLTELDNRSVKIEVEFRQQFAIFDLLALYQLSPPPVETSAQTRPAQAMTTGLYLVIEPPRTELMEFSRMAERARRPSAYTREASILALGRSHNPKALEALLDLLEIRDPLVQNAACQALAELGDSRATSALIRLAEKMQNPQAVRALGVIASKSGIEFLIDLLTDTGKESYLRATAANVIGEARLKPAVPSLAALVKQDHSADLSLRREALLALTRIDSVFATDLLVELAQGPQGARALQIFLEVLPKLDHQKILPLLAEWLGDWRGCDLNADDVQLMLDYIVAGSHYEMTGVLLEILPREPSAEVQYKLVEALSQLAAKNFGRIQYPVFNTEASRANRRVIDAWNQWWGSARRDPLYREQIPPANHANKI